MNSIPSGVVASAVILRTKLTLPGLIRLQRRPPRTVVLDTGFAIAIIGEAYYPNTTWRGVLKLNVVASEVGLSRSSCRVSPVPQHGFMTTSDTAAAKVFGCVCRNPDKPPTAYAFVLQGSCFLFRGWTSMSSSCLH